MSVLGLIIDCLALYVGPRIASKATDRLDGERMFRCFAGLYSLRPGC